MTNKLKRWTWEEWWKDRYVDFIIEISEQKDWTHGSLAEYEAHKYFNELANEPYIDYLEKRIEELEFENNEAHEVYLINEKKIARLKKALEKISEIDLTTTEYHTTDDALKQVGEISRTTLQEIFGGDDE